MNILSINGSHRKGNTQYLLSTLNNKLLDLQPSSTINFFNLSQKVIQFCSPTDYYCTKSKQCQCCRDDMSQMYEKIEKSDLIILGSPVYFSNVTARMKNFMDRLNCEYFNGKLHGKKVVVVGVGESQKNEFFFEVVKNFCQTLGMKVVKKFYARAEKADDLESNPLIDKQIEKLATQMSTILGQSK